MAIEVFLRGENQTGIFCEKKAAQPLFNWNRLFNPFQSSPLFSFSRLCVSSAIWPRPWFSISDNFNSILKIRNCQRQKFNPWKIWICLKNEIVSRAISLPGWLWFSISDISIQFKKIETLSSKDCKMGLKKCNCQQRNLTVARLTLIFSSRKVDCRLFPCNFV